MGNRMLKGSQVGGSLPSPKRKRVLKNFPKKGAPKQRGFQSLFLKRSPPKNAGGKGGKFLGGLPHKKRGFFWGALRERGCGRNIWAPKKPFLGGATPFFWKNCGEKTPRGGPPGGGYILPRG